jgi:hypothetical protein
VLSPSYHLLAAQRFPASPLSRFPAHY